MMCLFSPVLYYWTLFFPTLSGAAILLIAAMLGGYGGIVCGLLFPWLARSIFTQYHRMTTYQRFYKNCVHPRQRVNIFHCLLCLFWDIIRFPSRLPNPIYLGTLMAGLFHSVLCFYGKIMPNILNKCCTCYVHTYFCIIWHFLPCRPNPVP